VSKAQAISWEQWVEELNEEVSARGLNRVYARMDAATARDGWHCFFAAGFSPADGLKEDLADL
jgi:hypothetical protein